MVKMDNVMKTVLIVIGAVLLSFPPGVLAAEFVLTFQPAVVAGGSTAVLQWDEKNIRLSAPANNMRSRDYNYIGWQPSNGTAFVAFSYTAVQQPAVLTNTAGITFSLIQVDLAEYSTNSAVYPDLEFVGYRADGATVTNVFYRIRSR